MVSFALARLQVGIPLQGAPPPDPLDADPLDLVASQSHLLERPSRLLGLERGNSSNCQHLEPLPPANIQDLQVCYTCRLVSHTPTEACFGDLAPAHLLTRLFQVQVGLPEAAGSSGRAEDKEVVDEEPGPQQLQQLKKQHRTQLQERNRQICQLQEDREKLRQTLRKAEKDLRLVSTMLPAVLRLKSAYGKRTWHMW